MRKGIAGSSAKPTPYLVFLNESRMRLTSKNDTPITKAKPVLTWFLIILISAIILRILLFFLYTPVSYHDTDSYWRAARAVLSGFENYDGTRTPGYPVFLALAGTHMVAYALQLAMGLLITLGLFYIAWRVSDNPIFAALVAGVHTLNAGQLLFEANLLTETLSTFWIIVALVAAYFVMHKPDKHKLLFIIIVGVSSALAALTRPLFIFLPVLLAVFLAVRSTDKKVKVSWLTLVLAILPATLLMGGWMGWVNHRFGIFNLSTMGGYHTVQHTGNYFELVPDEDALLRDTYIEFRDARITETGTQVNTIWDTIPELQKASGLGFYELSEELQRISINLILHHPFLYLRYVIKGWWLFWRAPVYWSTSSVAITSALPLVKVWITSTRGFLFLANMVFILTSLVALAFRKIAQFWKIGPYFWLMAATVWASSFVQALVDHGDNPRFLVPIQSLVVLWVFWIALQTWLSRSKRSGEGEQK